MACSDWSALPHGERLPFMVGLVVWVGALCRVRCGSALPHGRGSDGDEDALEFCVGFPLVGFPFGAFPWCRSPNDLCFQRN
jgi:hypothetical protein